MQKIKLLTRDGQYVATVNMPIFTPPPEVILWGQRHFVRASDGRYLEAFCWVVVITEPD